MDRRVPLLLSYMMKLAAAGRLWETQVKLTYELRHAIHVREFLLGSPLIPNRIFLRRRRRGIEAQQQVGKQEEGHEPAEHGSIRIHCFRGFVVTFEGGNQRAAAFEFGFFRAWLDVDRFIVKHEIWRR